LGDSFFRHQDCQRYTVVPVREQVLVMLTEFGMISNRCWLPTSPPLVAEYFIQFSSDRSEVAPPRESRKQQIRLINRSTTSISLDHVARKNKTDLVFVT
jgi:hypothetical protein